MKVLMVITSLGMGGAEKVVTTLADQLVELGHEVKIAYLTGEALVVPKNKCISLVSLEIKSFGSLTSGYLKLRKLIDEFKPDVVHSHLVHANILCRTLRLSKTMPKLISSAHNTDEEGWTRFLAYRLTDKLADISTNVSDEAVEVFIEKKAVRRGRMLTLHNGISTTEFVFSSQARSDIRRELGVTDGQQLILAVGRLNEQKDYPNLLSAISEISDRYKNIKLVIVGDGPQLNKLKEKVRSLGLNDKVKFLGLRLDIPSLMSAADIFTLSSASEGFGLVVAEAMACSRVVVATDCGGVKEVVGDAGFLVPSKDSQKLAAALELALNLNDYECLQLGIKARQRVIKHYSLSTAVQKWLHLYSAPIHDLKIPFANEIQR